MVLCVPKIAEYRCSKQALQSYVNMVWVSTTLCFLLRRALGFLYPYIRDAEHTHTHLSLEPAAAAVAVVTHR
jgi:uncharacterized membrane protein YwaF